MIDRYAIADAAERLAPYIRRTPVIRLSEGEFEGVAELTLKLELLQHTGSFKPRGAFNRVLAADIPDAGLIAASGGNHGAAVAFVAQRLDVPAEIFVPEITGRAKRERITGYGARLIEAGATYADALAACRTRQAETGALEIHAYNHPAVLAGQGTIGHELSEQAPELTHLLVAVGGGGLIGGIGAWYGGRVHLVGVEPAACPCLHEARRVGHPVDSAVGGVAADSLGARQVGGLAFTLASSFVQESVLVEDAAIVAAQRWLWDRLRLIVEPGGATALAALLSGAFIPPLEARVGVLLCGANADPTAIVD
jgi:threonine dehydratase